MGSRQGLSPGGEGWHSGGPGSPKASTDVPCRALDVQPSAGIRKSGPQPGGLVTLVRDAAGQLGSGSQWRLLLLQRVHRVRLQRCELEQPGARAGSLERAPAVHAPRRCRPSMRARQAPPLGPRPHLRLGRLAGRGLIRSGRGEPGAGRGTREPGGQRGHDCWGSGQRRIRSSVTCRKSGQESGS